MTLEEAIIHAENVASRKAREANRFFRHGGSAYVELGESLRECSVEHRQLAEWLKELKAYRETYPYGVDRFNGCDIPFKGLAEDDDGTLPLSDCPWK